MPQLIFKGVSRSDVCDISAHLANELAEISDTPVDYFTIEAPETAYFSAGKPVEMYPLVEVLLFDRGCAVEAKMAERIQAGVKSRGYGTCEVYFIHIGVENYYES